MKERLNVPKSLSEITPRLQEHINHALLITRWAKSFNFNDRFLGIFGYFCDKFFSPSFIQWQIFFSTTISFSRCLIVQNQAARAKKAYESNWFLYPYQSDKRTKVKSEGRIPAKRLSWIICSDYMYSVRLHTVILYHVGYLTRFAMKANHFENCSYSMLIHSQYSDLSSMIYIKYIGSL